MTIRTSTSGGRLRLPWSSLARDLRRGHRSRNPGTAGGQYVNPVRVMGFNTAEGWSRDVSEDVADELRQRCADEMREMPDFLQEFIEQYAGPDRDVQLPLPIGY